MVLPLVSGPDDGLFFIGLLFLTSGFLMNDYVGFWHQTVEVRKINAN
jgi:hypothetical protein